MNPRNPPLSPASIGGASEWSVGKYTNDSGNPKEYFPTGRGQLIPRPNSSGHNGSMNGFPPGTRSFGGPSPPSSVGRRSNGTYPGPVSGRGPRDDGNWEATLGEHYLTFKAFLSNPGRTGKPSQVPNKARDKLLRLTLGQFLELSTDVYDELRRRQDLAAGRPAPEKLQEEDQFHEKRNEARGKLKFLSSSRFRDLATDVFLELERRFPRFTSGDIPRNASRSHTPVNGNGINNVFTAPLAGGRIRRPSEAGSLRSGAPPVQGMEINGGYGPPLSPPRNDLPPAPYDRPVAKHLGTNTIVPNKSTMVEEDDGLPDEDDGEPFGLGRASSARHSRTSGTTQPSAITLDVSSVLDVVLTGTYT